MTPVARLRSLALSQYAAAVEDLLVRAQSLSGDPDLAFIDIDDIAGSLVRFCRDGRASSLDQLALISGFSAVTGWCGLPFKETDYRELMAAARAAIRDHIAPDFHKDPPPREGRRHHLIFCTDLNGPLHSPSLGAVDYARAVADGDPDAAITFLLAPYGVHPATQAYAWKEFAKLRHMPRFEDFNRQETVEAIFSRGDDLITHVWCANALDPRITELAMISPTVMFTCADFPPFQYADVYWHQQGEDYVRALWRRCGVPELFTENYVGGAPCTLSGETQAFERRTKQDFGFSEDRLILATVGNRLAVDMGQDFLAGMLQLVVSDPRIVWLIIGPLDQPTLDLLGAVAGPQIFHVPFEPNLVTLLTMTDIFVNPFRKGGGGSALSAMRAGSIVLTRTDMGDVCALAPPEHGASSAASFFERLRALTQSPALRAAFLERQNARVAALTNQALLSRSIIDNVALARQRFDRRRGSGLNLLPDL